jgi:hypothetical protein
MRIGAVAVLLAACTDAGPLNVGPASLDESQTTLRNAAVIVGVAGDPSTGPSEYQMTLDGYWWKSVRANEEQTFAVSPGTHEVALHLTRPGVTQSWCSPVGPTAGAARFTTSRVANFKFNVACPQLTGEGSITVTVNITGLTNLTSVPIKVTRINGPDVEISFVAKSGIAVQETIPAGFYQFSYQARYCRFTPPYISNPPTLAVRSGTSSELRFSIFCQAPFFP